MGKKRIVKGGGGEAKAKGAAKAVKRKVAEGTLFVEATFNNTKVSVAEYVSRSRHQYIR